MSVPQPNSTGRPTPEAHSTRTHRAHQATLEGLDRLERALGHERFLEVCRWVDRSITVSRHGLQIFTIALAIAVVSTAMILAAVTTWTVVAGNQLTLYLVLAFILWIVIAFYTIVRRARMVSGLRHTAEVRDQLLSAVDVSRLRDDGLAVIFGDETTQGVKAKTKQVWKFYRFLDNSVEDFIKLPSVNPFMPHVRLWTRVWTIMTFIMALALIVLNIVTNTMMG